MAIFDKTPRGDGTWKFLYAERKTRAVSTEFTSAKPKLILVLIFELFRLVPIRYRKFLGCSWFSIRFNLIHWLGNTDSGIAESNSHLMRLSTVVHRAEIPYADHIKDILADVGATSHNDASTMKNLGKSLKQYFSLIPGDSRNLKSPKYPAGFSSQVK